MPIGDPWIVLAKTFWIGTQTQNINALKMSSHPKGALRLHGQKVSVIRNQVQNVLIDVSEGVENAFLLQPLLTQETPARNKQDVEISWL